VRAGVAYVNGLAFSLNRPVFCANSLQLLAIEAIESSAAPILCLRKAWGGNVYAGLFDPGHDAVMRHGHLESVVRELVAGRPQVTVAGTFRPEVKEALPETLVMDSNIEFPSVLTLLPALSLPENHVGRLEHATPINESSGIFNA
jgi:tRNA threonylcarbamoyladenosine biosynthesis protein TsaB